MSILSLSLHAKEMWDSHRLIHGILTGGIYGKLIVKRALKPWPPYNHFKNCVAVPVVSYLSPHFEKYSSDISKNILDNVLDKQQIAKLSDLLKNKMRKKTKGELFTMAATGTKVLQKAAYGYLFDRATKPTEKIPLTHDASIKSGMHFPPNSYSKDSAMRLVKLLYGSEYAEITRTILLSTLQPVCEKAVKKSASSLIKVAVSEGIDRSMQLVLSIFFQTIFFKALVSNIFQYTASQILLPTHPFDAHDMCQPGEDPGSNLTTILMGSIALHVSQLAYMVLKTTFTKEKEQEDKSRLLALVLIHAKPAIERKLRESPMFKYLEETIDQETIDSFISKLCEETIEFYWEDLKRKKVLGVPLVR